MRKRAALAMVLAFGTSLAFGAWGMAEESAPLEVTGMAMEYNTAPAKDGQYWANIEEALNVDYTVDWINSDNYYEKLSLNILSDSLPDIVERTDITNAVVQNAIEEGYFWDLTEFLGDFSAYPNLAATNADAWNYAKVNGSIYLVPKTRGNLDCCMMIRQDLLDQLGLALPETIEEFGDAMKQMVDAGLVDVGFVPFSSTTYYFGGAFGVFDLQEDENGGLIQEKLTDAYADMVAWYAEMYAAGVLPSEYTLIGTSQQEEYFTTGISGSLFKNAWHRYDLNENIHSQYSEDASVSMVPYLKGEAGTAGYWDLGYFGGLLISKNVSEEQVPEILKFLDACCAEESYNMLNYGVEGYHWNYDDDGNVVSTDAGNDEVTNSCMQAFICATNEWAKVDSKAASKEYNDETREIMSVLYDFGADELMDWWKVLQSPTWSAAWTEYQDDFDAMETKAVSGQITIEEFKEYQASLREMPEFQEAFQEFAEHYASFQ
ncbi:MAG: extracellular solute-binding protein [Eubacteriales bacterium]|nr:extracellular solute-binding protein [Eubacteriales bacterium]